MKKNDKAILLHRINYSESSFIVTLYTQENGLQKFIFQGGKKKAVGMFPLSLCEITYYSRPDSDLNKLTEANPYHMLSSLTPHPLKTTLAFFMADVLKQCVQGVQADSVLFHAIEECVIELDSQADVSMFSTYFLIQLAQQLGIEPRVEAKNKVFFHLQEGEFSDYNAAGNISEMGEGVELIQDLLRNSAKEHYARQAKRDAFDVMIHYFKLHIPRFDVDKSLGIIREVLYD